MAVGACAALLAAGTVGSPAAAAPVGAGQGRSVTVSDPAQYVNPFVGTKQGAVDYGNGGGAGNTFPGATAPLGMVQWSPDTVTYQHGGYFYDDQRIRGFSLTHISGAGCGDYGNIPFMPVLGTDPVAYSSFSHAHESASPGSYSVTFDNGVTTDLTTTQRTGIARFSYPAGQTASLTVDAGKAFNAASGSISIGGNTLSGYTDGGGFCGTGNRYRIYFTVAFDRPFTRSGIVTDGRLDTGRKDATGQDPGIAPQPARTAEAVAQAQSKGERGPAPHPEVNQPASGALALVSFDTSASRTVTARVGISFVSPANARANLAAEQGDTGFDRLRGAARTAWNDLLGRIAVAGGGARATRTFYTELYHTLLHPSVLSDVNGQYPGFDGQVHSTAPGHVQYADFSGWDIYRSQAQLLALLLPKEASDIGQSIVNQGAQGGYFDRWTLADGGTGVMVGDPLPIIAGDLYAFGATGFDAENLLWRALWGSEDDRERSGHQSYDQVGYVPVGTGNEWGPAADTLEYATADFALAQLAGRLGDPEVHDTLMHRSANWRNIFNTGTGYLQQRNADHSWPDAPPAQQDGFVEGDGAQYTWLVPYNLRGLFTAMGGDDAVVGRLDPFFDKLNAGPNAPYAYLGNEPSVGIPWAYDYAGRPDRAQDVVRRAAVTLYSDAPDGEPGNDDLGEMSSSVVWAALGMYPEVPGRAELVLASPMFPAITVTRGNGVRLEIRAPGASDAVRYVHGLRVGGVPSNRPWLGEDFVSGGGSLEYTLAADPDPGWGRAPADAPPSFDVGPATPATGTITEAAGKCVGVQRGDDADGTPVQLAECDGTAAEQWTVAPDGSVRALGKCLDIQQSGTAAGTPVQLYHCNGTGAQQWWPRPDGALLNPPSGRCLDLPKNDTTSGTRLQLWDCNGSAAQRWTVPR
ncbi:lectin [Kitasatospora sp. NPDC052896]|uniref:lectin n=1 Tax=Kitasatospora sp. NPDC052896 TaxID=3364061 RepID=UPI0037C637DF